MGRKQASEIHRLLIALAAERARRKSGGHLIGPQLEELGLELQLELDGDAESFAAALVDDIDGQLDDAIERVSAIRPGRVFCHRCADVECEHSDAPSSRHVFAGYTRTGTPAWQEFSQLCLDRRHPQTDRLFDDRPPLVTIVQAGDELAGGMIDVFRHRRIRLLGQVVAGFFTVDSPRQVGRPVLALTIQATLATSRRGRARASLNLVGRAPDGAPLESLWDRGDVPPWRGAVQWGQSATATLPRARPERIDARVEGILNGVARRLERDARGRSRRTRHAQSRHLSGERPTRKAIDDARLVAPESLVADEQNGTLVVLGERGRTHVFTPQGRHVTSVRYGSEAIQRKLQHGRWTPVARETYETFLKSLPVGGSD